MGKTFRSWRNKLYGHFKKHAHDLEYARAHPPEEKLWGERAKMNGSGYVTSCTQTKLMWYISYLYIN